jgi:5-hydroxyisourate hydrolase-like protein (transthyretin family)
MKLRLVDYDQVPKDVAKSKAKRLAKVSKLIGLFNTRIFNQVSGKTRDEVMEKLAKLLDIEESTIKECFKREKGLKDIILLGCSTERENYYKIEFYYIGAITNYFKKLAEKYNLEKVESVI